MTQNLDLWSIDWNGTRSHTARSVKMTILGSSLTLELPITVNTKVAEVKFMICGKLGIEPDQLKFLVKRATSTRTLYDTEEVPSVVTVKGIRQWEREKAKYPYPHCIIGGGHNGLRQALGYLKDGITDFTVYDKNNKVGGNAWAVNANYYSKLQTELGVYHLQYDSAYSIPKDMKTWPTRDDLLNHFRDVCEEFGIMPHVQLSSEVTEVQIVENSKDAVFHMPTKQHYNVTFTRLDTKSGDEAEVTFSSISNYPGALTKMNQIDFKGEDVFSGQIGYGMHDLFDYKKIKGERVAVMGFGAFGIENVRTCVEQGAAIILFICRRKNLGMPRCISWFCNQSLYPPPGAMVMDSMKPMYDLMFGGKGDDHWTYYGVLANKDRTTCTIRQKSRFGIGDIYFLASYFGKSRVVVDSIKRFKATEVLFEGGEKYEIQHFIKCFGYRADDMVDKVMGIKEMVGFFVNGDWRRWVCTEFHGVDAGKFGGTSLSPGAIMNADSYSWFVNYPKDLGPLFESGQLPRQRAKKDEGKPAYYYDPRTGSMIGMVMTGGIIPGLAEHCSHYGQLNRDKELEAHPLEVFVDQCEKEWNSYGDLFKSQGYDAPFPPYPYTKEFMRELCKKNDEEGEEEQAKAMARMQGQ